MYKSCKTKDSMLPDSIREDDEDSDIEAGKCFYIVFLKLKNNILSFFFYTNWR